MVGDFVGIVDMFLEYIVARAVDVLPRFEVILCQLKFCVDG